LLCVELDEDEDGLFSMKCNWTCGASLSLGNSSGECELLDCHLRKADASHKYPCGTSDCFQRLYISYHVELFFFNFILSIIFVILRVEYFRKLKVT
jgi:hypothetical protein